MAMINRRVKAIIQFRRATESEWIEKNPVLRAGEPALSIDKGLIKVGDGTKDWSSLPYSGSSGISIVAVNGTDLTPDINKRVNIIVPTKTSDLINDLRYATIDYVNENGGKIDNINVNGIRQDIINKTINLTIPTKTSELLNNSGFITSNDIPSIPTKVSELFNDVGYITITSIPTKISELENDSHFISQETDPTVPAWAKQTNKPTYTANEVGALPNDTVIPSKTSDLLNDNEFITLNDIPYIPSKTSDLVNDNNFISQEIDPTVPQWAKSSTKPAYTASEVGALPADTPIPTKTSDLTNNSGFISQETDPTVPQWAKALTKPTYTAEEVGALPDDTVIPSKISELDNDEGFITLADLPIYNGGVV